MVCGTHGYLMDLTEGYACSEPIGMAGDVVEHMGPCRTRRGFEGQVTWWTRKLMDVSQKLVICVKEQVVYWVHGTLIS